MCRDPDQSVVVRTVDNCPCNYPGNYYSNKRWCCGDSGSGSAHFDLSVWAFEKLAKSNSIGVMAVSFRQVPCDYRPSNPAPGISSPSPAEKPWSGAQRPDDQVGLGVSSLHDSSMLRCPWRSRLFMHLGLHPLHLPFLMQTFVKRFDSVGKPQGEPGREACNRCTSKKVQPVHFPTHPHTS